MNYIDAVSNQFPGMDLGRFAVRIFAMMVTSALIPKLRMTSIFGAILIVVALSLVNATIWSSSLFSHLPDELSARAGALVVANGVLFWVLVKLVPGIEVEGILPSIAAPIIYTLVTILLDSENLPWKDGVALVQNIIVSLRDQFQGGALNK